MKVDHSNIFEYNEKVLIDGTIPALVKLLPRPIEGFKNRFTLIGINLELEPSNRRGQAPTMMMYPLSRIQKIQEKQNA